MKSRGLAGTLALALISLLLPLSQTALAQGVTLSRTSLSFGSHAIGRSSSPLTVILVNSSNSAFLSISSIVATGEYVETDDCNGAVAPSGSCTLSIVFRPNAAGPVAGVVTINDDGNNSPQLITTSGTGVVPLSTSPTTLAFGTIAVGKTSAAQTVTVTNDLSSSQNIAFSASGDYHAAGTGTVPCAATLAGKASCTVAVQFAPTVRGAIGGSLTITQNANTIPQIVPFSGTGSGGTTPALVFSPKSENYGNVPTGSSVTRSVFVTNNGSNTVTISAIAASGGFTAVGGATSPCGGALKSGAQCSLSVAFSPATVGTFTGSVSVTDDSSVAIVPMDISGQGILGVTISPSTLTFPSLQQGTASAPQTVMLTNNLRSTLKIARIVTSGDYSTTNNCGTSLAASGTCTISVTFNPIARTGSVSGTLTVVSSSKSSPQVVELTGQSAGVLTRFAYAANAGDATVSMYTADVRTGQLRSNGYITLAASGARPGAVAVAPSNKFAYVIDGYNNTISGFAINSTTGQLAPSGPVLATGNIPLALAIAPSGSFIYVTNDDNTVSAYAVNTATGVLSNVPGSPFPAGSVSFSISLSPNGKFAYVSNFSDNTVSAYQISASTGALTAAPGSPFETGTFPYAVIVEPTSKYAYVVNDGDGTISAFQINSSNGALFPIGSPYPTDGGPDALAVDHSGQFLYATNGDSGDITAYSISPSTGALLPIAGSPFPQGGNPVAVTVDATNQFLYITDDALDNVSTYSINPTSGVLTLLKIAPARSDAKWLAVASGPTPITYVPKFAYVPLFDQASVAGFAVDSEFGALTAISGSPFASAASPNAAAVTPSGQFVYISYPTGVVAYSSSPATGALTQIAAYTASSVASALAVAVDPSGRFVYLADSYNDLIYGYSINPLTGTLTSVPGTAFSTRGAIPDAIAVDPSGRFLYTGNKGTNEANSSSVTAFTINPSTGALTMVSGSPYVVSDFGPSGVVVDPSGRFVYFSFEYDSSIAGYAINPGSGALTPLPGSPFAAGEDITSISGDPSGRFLYAATAAIPDVIDGYSINFSTGALTPIQSFGYQTGIFPTSVVVDPSGRFTYVSVQNPEASSDDAVWSYSIDPSTGALTNLTGSPLSTPGLSEPMAVSGIFH